MGQFLRLDVLVNGSKEFHVGDSALDASLLRHNWVVACGCADELGEKGYAHPRLSKRGVKKLMKEISGYKKIEDVCFVMCLWELDEETDEESHIKSHYKVSENGN